MFRVEIPKAYYLAWDDYPALGGGSGSVLEDPDAWADTFWYSSNGSPVLSYTDKLSLQGAWFVHPFDRDEECYQAKVQEFQQRGVQYVAEFVHPNGRSCHPWIDYFPYWKGYELIDILRSAEVTGPFLLNTELGDAVDAFLLHRQDLERYAESWVRSAKRRW